MQCCLDCRCIIDSSARTLGDWSRLQREMQMRLRSLLVERRAQEPPCRCLCKWRHTQLLQEVGCLLVVVLRLLDC